VGAYLGLSLGSNPPPQSHTEHENKPKQNKTTKWLFLLTRCACLVGGKGKAEKIVVWRMVVKERALGALELKRELKAVPALPCPNNHQNTYGPNPVNGPTRTWALMAAEELGRSVKRNKMSTRRRLVPLVAFGVLVLLGALMWPGNGDGRLMAGDEAKVLDEVKPVTHKNAG